MIYNLVKILQDRRGISGLGIETGDSRICRIRPNFDYQNLVGALSAKLKFDLILVVVRENVVVLVVVGSR